MIDNPYYRLLSLIRAQQTPNTSHFFTAKLQQSSPPLFSVGEATLHTPLLATGLTLSQQDVGADFLLLWLDGQALLLCRLEESNGR